MSVKLLYVSCVFSGFLSQRNQDFSELGCSINTLLLIDLVRVFQYDGRVLLLSWSSGTTQNWQERNTTQDLVCSAAPQCRPDMNCWCESTVSPQCGQWSSPAAPLSYALHCSLKSICHLLTNSVMQYKARPCSSCVIMIKIYVKLLS